jgi:hypothetical protein
MLEDVDDIVKNNQDAFAEFINELLNKINQLKFLIVSNDPSD